MNTIQSDKRKNPAIGGLGCLLLVIGFLSLSAGIGQYILAAGGIILIYALITGNVKLLG